MKAVKCRMWMPERDHCRPTDPICVAAEADHSDDIPWQEPFEANAVLVPLAEWEKWQELREVTEAAFIKIDNCGDFPLTATSLRSALDAVRPQ